jgi:hypothetical protein
MPKKPKKEEKFFQIVAGFNITTDDGEEVRFEVGKSKPNFVQEEDFTPKQWKALVEMGAVVPAEDVPELEEELKGE